MALEFLSEEWFAEAKKLADEAGADASGQSDLTLNIVVTGGPSGDKEIPMSPEPEPLQPEAEPIESPEPVEVRS